MSFLFELVSHIIVFIMELIVHLLGKWVAHKFEGSFDWVGQRVTGLYDWIIG